MEKDSGHKLRELAVDGGMSNSDLCMQVSRLHLFGRCEHEQDLVDDEQTQADIIRIPVDRPEMRETTALGAAIAAGFAVDVWKESEELKEVNRANRTSFKPAISQKRSDDMFHRWERAVQMAKGWIDLSENIA